MFRSVPVVCSILFGSILFNAVIAPPAGFSLSTLSVASTSPSLSNPQISPQTSLQISQRSLVGSIMNIFQSRSPQRGGIRRSGTGEFCPISPGLVGNDLVWNTRPMLLWQGAVSQVMLREFDSEQPNWNQPVDGTIQKVAYSGTALQPGQLYEWGFSRAATPGNWFLFEVIGGEQRQQIDQALAQLETQLSGKTDEEKALAKSEFFMQRDLWSDAFQMLASIEQPSSETQAALQKIMADVCVSPKPTGQ